MSNIESLTVVPIPQPPTLVGVTLEQAITVVQVGNVGGPKGDPGKWVSMTQAQYDAIPVKDPETLYVIIN